MSESADYLPTVGDSFRCHYGNRNRNNKLIHIRAIVDDEYIVYRYRKNGAWLYRMTDPTFFEVGMASGHITKVKAKEKSHAEPS